MWVVLEYTCDFTPDGPGNSYVTEVYGPFGTYEEADIYNKKYVHGGIQKMRAPL